MPHLAVQHTIYQCDELCRWPQERTPQPAKHFQCRKLCTQHRVCVRMVVCGCVRSVTLRVTKTPDAVESLLELATVITALTA